MSIAGILAVALTFVTSAAFAEEASTVNPDHRVKEPILLEGRSFRLFFDRQDPTFRLEDRQTSQSWHTALDRRGFASLLLPSADGDLVEWPIDKMERLRVQSSAIRFRAASSRGEIPEIDIELAIGAPVECLRISFSTKDPFLDNGGAVKIIDRLWMRDGDSGGALIPVGLGEWMDVTEKADIKRAFGCSGESDRPSTPLLRGMGLHRGRSGLLLSWENDGVEGLVTRQPLGVDASRIGEDPWSLETTVVLRRKARSLRIFVMGPCERHDFFNTYRQVLSASGSLSTVRSKTRRASGPPPFVGSAIFRVPLGSSSAGVFEDVAKLSQSFLDRLKLDRACWIVENWLASAEDDSGWIARVDRGRGGEKGLVACAKVLRDNAHVLGLDFPVIKSCEDTGAVEVQERLDGLQSILGQPLLMIRDDRSPEERDQCGLPPCIDELATRLEERFHLLGASRAWETIFRRFSYVEGAVDSLRHPLSSSSFYPFVPAVVGRRARLGVTSDRALQAGDADAVLDFLLLGEVPLFALPGHEKRLPADSASHVFSRDDGGWFEGRELQPQERFIKTSYEVLTYLARLRAREELHSYERLGENGAVQKLHYGFDLRIILNRGEEPYEDPDGKFVLPQYGFWIQHPFYFAFHATMANGVSYEKPALFTVRPLENKLWLRASKVRIWHAFGEPVVRLGGKRFEVVKGEMFTKIW